MFLRVECFQEYIFWNSRYEWRIHSCFHAKKEEELLFVISNCIYYCLPISRSSQLFSYSGKISLENVMNIIIYFIYKEKGLFFIKYNRMRILEIFNQSPISLCNYFLLLFVKNCDDESMTERFQLHISRNPGM